MSTLGNRPFAGPAPPLWRWRGFILATAVRELRSRHARSLLGWIWLVVPPLVLIAIYALVFSRLMRGGGLPDHGPYTYSLYLCAGVLPWQWFSELLTRTTNLFVQHAQVIKKTPVPWTAMLAVEVLVATFGLAIQMGLFVAFVAFTGVMPEPVKLVSWLPALMTQGMMAVALGLSLAVFQVFLRDVGIALTTVLQVWFWLTPLVYPISIIPQVLQPWLALNPAATLASAAQAAFVPGLPGPSATHLAAIALGSVLLGWLAARMAWRNLPRIRDEL